MGKREEEECCFENLGLRKDGKVFASYVKNITGAVQVQDWNDRPDFLAVNGQKAYAIEHFMVDQVYVENRSSGRIVNEKLWDIYEINHTDLVNNQFDSRKAVKDIQDTMQAALDFATQFDYDVCMKQFDRIFSNHVKKIPKYKENLEKYKNVKLYFLIELNSSIISQSQGIIQCVGYRKDNAPVFFNKNTIIITDKMMELFESQIGILEGVIIQQYVLMDMKHEVKSQLYIDLSTENAMWESLKKQRIEIYRKYDIYAPQSKLVLDVKDN